MYYDDINSTKRRDVVVIEGHEITPDTASTVDWKPVLAAYITRKDCKASSRRAYVRCLTQFFHWVEKTGRKLNSLTEVDILEWKDWLVGTGHAPKTMSLYLISVRGFYEWAEAQKLYPNIARSVKGAKRSESRKGFLKMHLTDEQGAAFLQHFKEGNIRDYAMMNLMIRTGLRSVEVSRANINDIQIRGGRKVLFVQGKGRLDKSEFVVLTETVSGPIEEYLATRPGALDGEPLFVGQGKGSKGRRLTERTIQYIGKEGMRAIGLDNHAYSVHSLRHTAGVQILKRGGTQFDVQDVLRHASPVTSQIYLESIKEERRIETAPEQYLDGAFENPKNNE